MNFEFKVIIYGLAAIWVAWKLHEIFIKENEKKQPDKKDNYRKLLTATLGDKSKRERLIKYEITRDNSINYEEAAKRAIDRLQRDRK